MTWSSVVWWELGISTELLYSTPKGLAFGPRLPASQYVDSFYFVRPYILCLRSKPWVSFGEFASQRRPGAELED